MENKVYLQKEEIKIQNIYPPPIKEKAICGAFVIFCGIVRNHNSTSQKEVSHLEYEAHENLAIQSIQEIIRKANKKWPLHACHCIHRLGLVPVGTISIFLFVQSIHRKEAYLANSYIMDKIKAKTPIWKKEVYSDGTYLWSPRC